MDCGTDTLNDYEHRHMMADPIAVGDFGTVVLTFSDGTKEIVMSTDLLLGKSKTM